MVCQLLVIKSFVQKIYYIAFQHVKLKMAAQVEI